MTDHFIQSGDKLLRCGYTTGTCAALAAQGAARLLLTGTAPASVSVQTPKGWTVDVEPAFCSFDEAGTAVSCGIQKDAGDDPDITNGMTVIATVSRGTDGSIAIDGGEGVGRVTKPGLDQPVGAAAINRVPRAMIEQTLLDLLEELETTLSELGGLDVVISIPGGEEKAQKTFNPKLGIEGGLSVLGTSGIVEPMSEQALIDTIGVELRQASALQRQDGIDAPQVILTPGNYGRDFLEAQGWTALGVPLVKMSNYVGAALDAAAEAGIRDILLAGHIGKLVKVAGGARNTHSSVSDRRTELFAEHAGKCGADGETRRALLDAATTDACIAILDEAGLRAPVLQSIGSAVQGQIAAWAGSSCRTGTVIFSNEYGLLYVSPEAEELLRLWEENV